MPLVVPQGMLIRLVWSVGGSPTAVNVVGARTSVGALVNQGMADAVSGMWKTAFTSSTLAAHISTQVTLATVSVRSIATASQPEFVGAGAPVAGTAVGNLLPPQVALCVTLRTALAGRSYRGRFYQFGFPVGETTADGGASAAAVSASVAFINAAKDAMSGASVPMAIISRKLNTSELVTLVMSRDSRFETIRKRAIPGI